VWVDRSNSLIVAGVLWDELKELDGDKTLESETSLEW
jgi:hypothetical protein